MTTAVQADMEQLRNEVVHLRRDLSHISETLQSLVQHGIEDVAGRAQRSKAGIHESLKAKTAGIAEEIEENPLTASLVSFAIGALLGALVGGRR
jgi:ElaB/YqjD/DUF883 family membrane-anchored ribosome-binding protein